jgi:predicted permease
MFKIAFSNVLIILLFVLMGYLLCKTKKAKSQHLPTLSAVLIYLGNPCLIISAFTSLDYSTKHLKNMGLFFIISLILQLAFIGVTFLFVKNRYEQPKFRIFNVACVLGNVGFFGLPVIQALFPNNPEVASYSVVYIISMNIILFTIGAFCLTKDKRYMSLKSAFINPAILGLIIGLPLFLLSNKFTLPSALTNGIGVVGKMTTPLCMFILGIRLATVPFKKLFTRPMVYLTIACKLLVYPLFCYALVYFLPLPLVFKGSVLVLSSTPCASKLLSLSELYDGEKELTANSILLSTLLCFITVPLLTLLI